MLTLDAENAYRIKTQEAVEMFSLVRKVMSFIITGDKIKIPQ